MNESGILKKIKYILGMCLLFLAIVLVSIYINMRNTIVETKNETKTLFILQNLELIHLNTVFLDRTKNEYLQTGNEITFNEYNRIAAQLKTTTNNLLQFSINNNYEKETLSVVTNKVINKISLSNKSVDIKKYINLPTDELKLYDSLGQTEFQQIITGINEIEKKGLQVLQKISREREETTTYLSLLFIAMAILFSICIAGAYIYLRKNFLKSKKVNNILLHNSTLLKNISDAIITTDQNLIITDWNKHAKALYGYTYDEVKGKSVNNLLLSVNNKTDEHTFSESFLEDDNWKGETLHYHKDGSIINVDVSKSVIKDTAGNNIGSISVVRNITQKIKMQQELQSFSQNLQQQVNIKVAELNFFFERIADAFIAFDNNWNYTYLNKTAIELHQFKADELVGKNIWELFPDLKTEPFYEALQQAKQTQQATRCELYYSKDDKWFANLIYPSKDGLSVYYHEITNKKKAELSLKKALEKLNFHISNTPLGIMEFDSEMNILQWNEKATEIFGWTDKETIGTGFKMDDAIYPEDKTQVLEQFVIPNKVPNKNSMIKNRNITKDGKVIYCEWYNSIITDENNNITGMLSLVKNVTEAKLSEIEKANAEAKFRSLVEQSLVGVYIRKEHKLLYVNPRFAKIFGYTEEELYADFDALNLVDEAYRSIVEMNTENYIQKKISTHHYEFKGIHKSGKPVYCEIYGTLTIYNNEETIIGTVIDITERKRASELLTLSERALQLSNEKYELVAKATNDGVWEWDVEADILKGNESFCHLLSIENDKNITYEFFDEQVHEDDRERLKENFRLAVAKKAPVLTEEFRFSDKNGGYKTIYDRAYILYRDDKPYRMLGAMQDITAMKETEQKLLLEKELSDSIINSLPGIFYLFTKEGKYLRWNKNFETVTGYSAEEIKKLHPLDFFTEEEKEMVEKKIANVFLTGIDKVEANCKTKNKTLIPFYFTGSSIVYEKQDCIMGVGLDISEKVKSQNELVASEQKFRTLVQQASDGIVITDEDGNFLDVNESAATLTGFTKKELDSMNTSEIFFEEGGFSRPLKYGAMANGAVVISEHIIKRKGGKLINVEVSAKQLSDGRFQRILRDITERTQVEEALRISEKKYRLLFNDNPLPMWISAAADNRFLDVNNASLLSYGYTKEAFLNMSLQNIRVEGSEEILIAENNNKDSLNMESIWEHIKKDGSKIKVNVLNHDIIYEGKKAILSLANDITSKVEAEENLQKSNDALRDLASHLESIRENERSHMAREIHDELGQQLTGLKMDISWLNRKIKSTDAAVQEKMQDTISLIDKTVITVRRIATQLRPSILDDLGLIAAMEWQSEEFEKRSEIKSVFTSNVSTVTIKAAIATAVFRIFQESLTNVLRHSKATEVISFFRINEDLITLIIEDNGVGFNEKEIANKKTLGLLGMKERILLINGTYEINGNSGKGTSVIITVPLK